MDRHTLSVRQGETLPLLWTNDEEGALTATITVSDDNGVVLTKTVDFDGLTADLTLDGDDTNLPLSTPENKYKYMVTLVYDDDTVEKYPDVDNCEVCTLPTLKVCAANDEESS